MIACRLRDKKARGEPITIENFVIDAINNGNRTEWSPIRSVVIRVINKIRRQLIKNAVLDM